MCLIELSTAQRPCRMRTQTASIRDERVPAHALLAIPYRQELALRVELCLPRSLISRAMQRVDVTWASAGALARRTSPTIVLLSRRTRAGLDRSMGRFERRLGAVAPLRQTPLALPGGRRAAPRRQPPGEPPNRRVTRWNISARLDREANLVI